MSSEKCKSCGYSFEGQPKFCPECGANLKTGSRPKGASRGSSQTSSRDTAIVFGAILIATVAFIFYRIFTDKPAPGQADPAPTGVSGITPSMLNQLPNDYNALVSMGNQFMDDRNYAVAVEVYGRALKIQDNPDVRTDRGACYHAMGQDEAALTEFRHVLSDVPTHSVALFNSGIVHQGTGQADSARFYWERYLELHPTGAAAGEARSYLEGMGE